MDNDEHAEQISKMDVTELLIEVLSFPEGMTDSYYRYFRDAVIARAVELGVY